ncbi:MAG: DUF5009 domain-containing protein [Kiritimatiellia bacterium]
MGTSSPTPKRLLSLDILRGLDMIFLTVAGVVAGGLDRGIGLPDCILKQFDHPWGGFTAYDLIMPLFIFMSGAAVPLALRKWSSGYEPLGRAFMLHLVRRVSTLWLLGLLAQGNLLSFDWPRIELFSNTLQAIAVGYAATVCVLLFRPRAVWIAPLPLTLSYSALLAFGGDYSPQGNLAIRVEHWLTSPRPQQIYTWYLTSLMFAAMALWGAQSSLLLERKEWSGRRRAGVLFAYGAGLLLTGFALMVWIPSIKQIYTASFTLRAVGISMMLLATLYGWVDCAGHRRGWDWAVLYGRYALTAYVAHELLGLLPGGLFRNGIVQLLTQGVAHHFGQSAQLVAAGFVAAAIPLLAILVHRAIVRPR